MVEPIGLLLELLTSVREFVQEMQRMKGEQRKKYLEQYVGPAFSAAEQIYRDYKVLLVEVRSEASEGENPDRIISLLKQRREELYPLRSRLRADIAVQIERGRVTRFESGLIGLMSGAMTSVERPYFQTYSYVDSEGTVRPVVGQHTVLDLLDRFERSQADDFNTIRGDLVQAVNGKLRGLENAWLNVVHGYAELKEGSIPAPPKTPESSPQARNRSEIESHLNNLYGMAATGLYSRKRATDFEKLVAKAAPELHPFAQELREIVHDLDAREPNVTGELLRERLNDFVLRFDRPLPSKATAGDQPAELSG